MRVGVPTEIKTDEYRVALTPSGVRELTEHGHDVLVQQGAGVGSAITDEEYVAQGARIAPDADAVFAQSDMIVKVKEPQPDEVARLEPRHTLFTYLHLAPDPGLTRGLMESGATCVAYETVEDTRGRLPLLAPMSEVAGKIATQAGAFMLEKPLGGRGILLGGVPGVASAKVMVIGGGVVGMNAAFIAIGMEAEVYVYDRNLDRLRELDLHFGGRASTCYASTLDIEQRLPEVDLVIGAVLVHGARAPVRHPPRAARADEAGGGPRRRLHRPGRLLRDLPAHDPLRPDLRGRRRHALLRGQHARRGPDHLDLRADQRHAALRARPRRARRRGRAPGTTRAWPRGSTWSAAR
jgi:alanine dehydrogenase